MSSASHQTIRLDRGRHAPSGDRACVMELASMLAGEPFSDHPQCVCPVIGSFLRAYNDCVSDRRRQDLYPYAALIVGSRASLAMAGARAERVRSWQSAMKSRRTRSFMDRLLAWVVGSSLDPSPETEGLGGRAVASIGRHTDETHEAALKLIEELVAIAHEPVTPALDRWSSELRVLSPQI